MIYLFSLGLGDRRHRSLIVQICRHFGYQYRKPLAGSLPVVAAEDVAPVGEPIAILEVEGVDGNVTAEELIAISRIVRSARPRESFEFGTFDGRTTLNIAANSPDNAVVYTLDLPAGEPPDTALRLDASEVVYATKAAPGARLGRALTPARIVQLYGDSARFDFARYAGTIDFIFIDASHAYDYVIHDSRTAMKMLRPEGGTILWHDYGSWDGVTAALDFLRGSDPAFSALARIRGTTLARLKVG